MRFSQASDINLCHKQVFDLISQMSSRIVNCCEANCLKIGQDRTLAFRICFDTPAAF